MADYDEEDFEEDFEEEELEEEELSDDGGGFGAKPAAQPPPSKEAAPASKPSPSKMMGGFQPPAMLEAASSDDDDGSASIKSASSGRSTTKPPPTQLPPADEPKAAEPDVDDMLSNYDAMLKGYQSAQASKPEPSKPPSSESGRDNAKLDNLLAGLEADVAETEQVRLAYTGLGLVASSTPPITPGDGRSYTWSLSLNMVTGAAATGREGSVSATTGANSQLRLHGRRAGRNYRWRGPRPVRPTRRRRRRRRMRRRRRRRRRRWRRRRGRAERLPQQRVARAARQAGGRAGAGPPGRAAGCAHHDRRRPAQQPFPECRGAGRAAAWRGYGRTAVVVTGRPAEAFAEVTQAW
jgi:hypothetical protein